MTEAEWLRATSPDGLLQHLEGKASTRRLRLFGCAACRLIWDSMPDPRSRNAVEVAERYADGIATHEEADQAGDAAAEVDGSGLADVHSAIGWRAVDAAVHLLPESDDRRYLWGVGNDVSTVLEAQKLLAEGAPDEMLDHWSEQSSESGSGYLGWTQADPFVKLMHLLRCVFGNPFRPVAFDPRWRSETAVALAAGIYDGRHFDRLPILADALEDAGCDSLDLLNHLRGPGPHARGCWAVDAVLGRS